MNECIPPLNTWCEGGHDVGRGAGNSVPSIFYIPSPIKLGSEPDSLTAHSQGTYTQRTAPQ